MTAIRVAHAGADYEVVVGDLAEALPRIEVTGRGASACRSSAISASSTFMASCWPGWRLPEPILVPEGEAAKDWHTLGRYYRPARRA